MTSRIIMRACVAAIAAVTLGCGNGIPTPTPIQSHVALTAFSDCGSLEKYIQDTAVLDMRSELTWLRDHPVVFMADNAGAGGTSPATNAAGPSAYTKTNTQVAGVDEADLVKNDGTRIFVLSGDALYLNTSWPATALKTTAKLSIEGWPREMFLDESNHVIVFSTVYTPSPLQPKGTGGASMAPIACGNPFDCGYWQGNTTKITVVDVTNMSAPKVTSEIYQPGWYWSSRRIGSSVRLVQSNDFLWPQGVKWYPDYDPVLWNDKAAMAKAYDALMDANERIIRSTPLEVWLPKSFYKDASGNEQTLEYSCSEFSHSNAPERLGLMSIVTIDLAPQLANPTAQPSIARTSLVAEPGTIYASPSAIYLASQHWWWWPETGQQNWTYVHKFDITDPTRATYVASGGAPGYVLNQFSLDEDSAGNLRVASNLATRVMDNDNNPWGTFQVSNQVTVLGAKGDQLQIVGQTPELAPGEWLESARFMGTKGFVTTFRSVDPLFTLDLSDPTHPRKVAELTVPGFSSYMQPIDDTHILSIGEVSAASGGWNWTVNLSIFDVSDLLNPRQTFTQTVGSGWGYSEALWDHHAFNYFPQKKLLAIPFFDWNPTYAGPYWDYFVSQLRVFSVDTTTGIAPLGAVDMKDVYEVFNYDNWTWYWSPTIRRSVMADNFVYAVSDAGIRVEDVTQLGTPLATTLFDRYVDTPTTP